MRLTRPMLTGAALGFLVGVAFTVLSLFQYDPEEVSAGQLIVAGLVIGVPISVVGGVFVGWVWGRVFRQR
jgi:hypothetical protein